MNLQTHYAQLIESEYTRLAKPRRYSWRLSMWLLSQNEEIAKRAILGGFQVFFIALMALGYGLFRLAAPYLDNGEGLLGAALLVFGGFAFYCWGMNQRNHMLDILKAHDTKPLPSYEFIDLMDFLKQDARLQAIVTAMLGREGTEQLTQAQGRALIKSAEKIRRWKELESERAQGVEELEKLGLVSKARLQKRAETLDARLPSADIDRPAPSRF